MVPASAAHLLPLPESLARGLGSVWVPCRFTACTPTSSEYMVSAHLSTSGKRQTSFLYFVLKFLSLLSCSLGDHGLIGLALQ